MNSPFRVSICGGGIGGLTLALVISKYGKLPVDIFEAGPTITTVGAGISFFVRTMDMMKDLELYDEFIKMAHVSPQENTVLMFRKSDQQEGHHWLSRNLTCGIAHMHRKDLIEFLLRQVQASCNVYTSKKLKCYDVHPETGKITLHFSDSSRAITDVLVGADGIHSATRRTMYQKLASSTPDDSFRKKLLECIDPVWTGVLVYRSLIPATKFLKECPDAKISNGPSFVSLVKKNHPHCYDVYFLFQHLGKEKYIVIFPISQGRLLNVVIMHYTGTFGSPFEGPWVTDVSEKDIQDQFKNWEMRCKTLAKCVERPSRWALHALRPLPRYVDGKVVLLGDAAHAMEPHFGAGAGQAMEDAFVLGRLLTHELTHQRNVADAIKVYERVRLPVANNIAQRSHDVGRYYSLEHVSADDSVNVPAPGSPEERDHVCKLIEDAWQWQDESVWLWGDAERRWRESCSMHAML